MQRLVSLGSRAQLILHRRGAGTPQPPVKDLQPWSGHTTPSARSHGRERREQSRRPVDQSTE
jgi:hypothetical protein